MFILVQCNTSLSKNYIAHSVISNCSLCDRLNLRNKTGLSVLSVYMKSLSKTTQDEHINLQQQIISNVNNDIIFSLFQNAFTCTKRKATCKNKMR